MTNASFSITNPKLSAALVAFQGEIGAVAKTSANPFFKSKYAALPDVVAHAQPILAKHGLAVSQTIGFWQTVDGQVLDTLATSLIHESGEYMCDTMRLHLPKDDPQGQGSAVTYARRYAYMAILGLVADEDDDGNAGSKPQAQSRPAQNSAPATASPQIQAIIDAAKADPDDEFLNSLAEQWATKGKLSDKQIAAGNRRAAGKKASVESAITSEFGYSGEPF
jgi:hypothetical protein